MCSYRPHALRPIQNTQPPTCPTSPTPVPHDIPSAVAGTGPLRLLPCVCRRRWDGIPAPPYRRDNSPPGHLSSRPAAGEHFVDVPPRGAPRDHESTTPPSLLPTTPRHTVGTRSAPSCARTTPRAVLASTSRSSTSTSRSDASSGGCPCYKRRGDMLPQTMADATISVSGCYR